jgi:hypothetical protein
MFIFLQSLESRQSTSILRAEVSSGICDHLRERILALERHFMSGLWMNVDAYDEFSAGTILGYRGDVWETIANILGLGKQTESCKVS